MTAYCPVTINCCSPVFLPQENRAIVDGFLAANAEFKLRPVGEVLAQQKIPLEAGECLQLLPETHGTDAFFAAVLERTKSVAPSDTDPA